MSLRPLLAALLLAAPTAAQAQNKLNDGQVALTLKLPSESGSFTIPNEADVNPYFNFAQCLCDTDSDTKEYRIEYSWVAPAPATIPTEPLHPWSGVGCDNDMTATRDEQCVDHAVFTPVELASVKRVDYDARDLMLTDTERAAGTCPNESRTVQHWVVTQTGATWDGDDLRFKLTKDIVADMQAPPLPSSVEVVPIEEAIKLRWTVPTDATDIAYYQALCSKLDGTKVHSTPTNTARFETPQMLCGGNYRYDIGEFDVTGGPAVDPEPLPDSLAGLDEAFVCGEATGTAGEITLNKLENDVAYRVVLISIDLSHNLTARYVPQPLTPVEVIDLWESIDQHDGKVEGGFCVAQVGRGGDGVGGALVILGAALVAVRRRRRRRSTAKLALLSLVALPTIASAQPTYSPYWDTPESSEVGLPESTWVLGARLGPYVPDIDKNFSGEGPYAEFFEKDSAMFAVDLHRVWTLDFGQVGVGGTVGYYSNSALAFEKDTEAGDMDRPRADGNLSRLSIMPLHVTATYRATILDDRFGVPIVPYARAGVAYDVWWIRKPNEEIAELPDGNRALGATLGLVGAIGIAIRAERIDGDAAASMRGSGLEHAGFFAELETGYIDGFGDETKLSVGDTTFFGGINFEF